MTATNPLLDLAGLPQFDKILPEHVTPAIDYLLAELRKAVECAESQADPCWDNLTAPLEDAKDRLRRAWSQVAHLQSVGATAAMREAYSANLGKLAQFSAELAQNTRLYSQFRRLAANEAFASECSARRRAIENEIRNFELGGVGLDEQSKQRLADIKEELSRLGAQFDRQLLEATNAFSCYVEREEELSGVPLEIRMAARGLAEQEGRTGWKLTLQAPCFWPVLRFADNRALRETMYRAYISRASEFGPAAFDNSPVIERILTLRAELADLLGHRNYAEYSLADKMAGTPDEVLAFLRGISARAKPHALAELDAVTEFTRQRLGLEKLEAWDMMYTSEKLREASYSFSEQEVKAYFTEPKVLSGLFDVIESLYSVTVTPAMASVWHPDVRFYRIKDRDGRHLGDFYLDLYAREGKRGGAWVSECRNRCLRNNVIETPVVYLICNFGRGQDRKPATFSHAEVMSLFHEMGHCLHHLLTEVDEGKVSGTNGIEWDAIELPSQLMENFCWEWNQVKRMTSHVDTGEPLPRALFERMLAARNFQCGMRIQRQIEFGLIDMELHCRGSERTETTLELAQRIGTETAVYPTPPYNRFLNGFSHIFSGAYAAGYYSYQWADVMAADAYAAFKESSGDPAAIGRRFRNEILAAGGSRPAQDSFAAFRGRPLCSDAFLRQYCDPSVERRAA